MMAEAAAESGVTVIAATPHCNVPGSFQNTDPGEVRRRLEDFSADPRAAALKVAIVASERDGIVARCNAEFLKRIFPQASLTWVPGMEHVLPITASHVVDAAVRSVR